MGFFDFFFGICLVFFFNFSGEFFWRNFFGGIFLEERFGRNCLEGFFWEEFLVYIGIDLFVKILDFVKILTQWRRKEGGRTRILDP